MHVRICIQKYILDCFNIIPTYLTREGFGILNLFRNELEVGGTIQNLGDT